MSSETERTLDDLGRAVQDYQSAVDDTDREMARILRVNRTDLRCLELLLGSAGRSPRELGERLGLTTGSVTAMLDRLERLGFLARAPHAEDGRRTVVTITEEGARRCAELVAPLVTAGRAELAGAFDADQLRVVMRFLRALTEMQTEHVARLQAWPR